MECDVIPDCSQEVDPLGNLENCDSLSDESCSYGGALNAQIISSSDAFIIQTSGDKMSGEAPDNSKLLPDETKAIKSNHSVRKLAQSRATITTTAPSINSVTTTFVSSVASSTFSTTITIAAATATTTLSLNQAPINNTTTQTATITASTTTPPTPTPAATTPTQASTMREVLASIPGFQLKPRRRTNKKMSTAAQLEQTREGCIDLETPDSILVGTNLRDLLNRHTFALLPPLYQYKLIQLLPDVDRPSIDPDSPIIRLNASSLNNEFFARACLEWRERLSEGEFTPENQLKLKTEAEKEMSKLDPWKLKHFEPIWGDSSGQSNEIKLGVDDATDTSAGIPTSANNYTTSSGRLIKSPTSYSSSLSYNNGGQKRQRTVGAVTRSSAAAGSSDSPTKVQNPVPDLLPLRTKTSKATSTVSPLPHQSPTNIITSDAPITQPTTTTTSEMSIVQRAIKDENAAQQIHYQQHHQQHQYQQQQQQQHQHHHQHQDIAIIATTIDSSNQYQMEKKKIPYVDLKPDIELIPIPCSSTPTTPSGSTTMAIQSVHCTDPHHHQSAPNLMVKRPPLKRSVSPDTSTTKVSKISDSCTTSDTDHIVKDILMKSDEVLSTRSCSNSSNSNSNSSNSSSSVSNTSEEIEKRTQLMKNEHANAHGDQLLLADNDDDDDDDMQQPLTKDQVTAIVSISSSVPFHLDDNERHSQQHHLDELLTATATATPPSSILKTEDNCHHHSSDTMTNNNNNNNNNFCGTSNIKIEPEIDLSDVQLYDGINDGVDLDLASIQMDSDVQQNSTESSEYSNDINSLSAENVTDKFDSNFNSNETDSLQSFCTDNIKLENIYKIQNFEGVLQIQPNTLTLEHRVDDDIDEDETATFVVQARGRQMDVMSGSVSSGRGSSSGGGGGGGGGGLVGPSGGGIRCDDSSNSTTTALADCSGENSADTAGVEELEPSIQNLTSLEDDPIEQKFTDAENYVLESGEISRESGDGNGLPVNTKLCGSEDIQAKIFAEAMARAFDNVPANVPVTMTVISPTDNAEVIPMQETLEVRLKESTYQVISEWPTFKEEDLQSHQMDACDTFSNSTQMHLIGDQSEDAKPQLYQPSPHQQTQQQQQQQQQQQLHQQPPVYSTSSQVKLELEVTLTPETEVSSTVVSNNSNNSCDSDQSNDDKLNGTNVSMPTVIPPTTIVCLPSLVTVPNSVPHQSTSMPSTYVSTHNPMAQQKRFGYGSGSNSSSSCSSGSGGGGSSTNNNNQRVNNSPTTIGGSITSQPSPRTAVVASSSSIPYLSIATTQPLRAVPSTTQSRPKMPTKGGRGSRTNTNKPPPGAVNLERSYQICQAVIQNSPNRHQLKAQLRPPPALLGSTTANSNIKKEENVSSTIKTNGQPRITFTKKGFTQRQPSPVLVRHVFTTNQGIPVSMAVLPSNVHHPANNNNNNSNNNNNNAAGQSENNQSLNNQSGQYILVQRTGIVSNDNHAAPRASSAPPAQNQLQQTGAGSITTITGRGRPASVDVDNTAATGNDIQHYIETTSGSVQTLSRKVTNQGFVYSDNLTSDTTYPLYSMSGENTPPNCACSLNAMVICQQCGVFCHDECMGSTKLCLSCVIR